MRCSLKKDIQHNDREKTNKGTTNNLQNTTQITKHRATGIPLNLKWLKLCTPEKLALPTPLVTPPMNISIVLNTCMIYYTAVIQNVVVQRSKDKRFTNASSMKMAVTVKYETITVLNYI